MGESPDFLKYIAHSCDGAWDENEFSAAYNKDRNKEAAGMR